ncbi:hypothetical protein ACRRTK_007661 [Alexandromys fortis]
MRLHTLLSPPPSHSFSCYCLLSQAGAGSFLGDGGSPGCRQPSRQYKDRKPQKGPGSERRAHSDLRY